MDRFVVKEPRSGASAGYLAGQQVVTFPETQTEMVPEAVYYRERYANEFPNVQQQQIGMNMTTGFMRVVHASPYPQHGMPPQAPAMSGIDPNYLSAYSTNNAAFIASQKGPPLTNMTASFGNNYENRNLIGAERTKLSTSINQNATLAAIHNDARNREVVLKNSPIQSLGNNFNSQSYRNENGQQIVQHFAPNEPRNKVTSIQALGNGNNCSNENYRKGTETGATTSHQRGTNAPVQSVGKIDEIKMGDEMKVLSRADKLKALYKSGPRAFSGPVEKVLKWHKALQEIGLLVIYEIVAKCVSIRPGDSCAKHLVIRDDNGPAMQVVYYEIDFLLPELKPGCTVRIVGRMMAGTSRFQAFNVRPATGDDVATLPRRAAVAMHHVAKLCKEYGVNFQLPS